MIRVLKSTREVKCNECHNTLEFEYCDVKKGRETYDSGYGYSDRYYKFIKCPVCGQEVRVD